MTDAFALVKRGRLPEFDCGLYDPYLIHLVPQEGSQSPARRNTYNMSTNTTHVDYSPEYMAQSCGSALIIISALFITLDTIFVALRFYGHSLAHVSLGLDDLIIPIAWIAHVGLCILGIGKKYEEVQSTFSPYPDNLLVLVTNFGAGHHFDYLSQDHPDQVVAWAKSMYASQWLYPVCVALPKISILLSYLRVIIDKPTRIACHVLIWILIVNMLAYMIASAVQCIPLEYIWNMAITGTCFNIGAFWTSTSVPNFVTDLLMLLLPLKTISALKVSRWSKAGMAFIFLSGGM